MRKRELQARNKSFIRNDVKLFLFILPVIIFIFVSKYMPLWGWSFAFFRYKPGRALLDCEFVGWKNFIDLFKNPLLRKNIVNSLKNTFGIHGLSYVFSPLPNYKRQAMDGMLEKWMIKGSTENLYFMVNSAKELVVESKDFQLLNASTQEQIYLKANGNGRYQLKLYDFTGGLINEIPDVSLAEPMPIDQSVMLIKAQMPQ